MGTPLENMLESAEVQAFATGFPTTLAHLSLTLLLLAAATALYVRLTPWKEIALVREGNVAAALAFAAVLVGLSVPLATSLAVSISIRDLLIWGVATVALQLLVFRLVDAVLVGLPRRIQSGEIAAALVLAGAKLGTALILAAALTG